MLREIKNDLYCITFYNGNKKLVECERGEELIVCNRNKTINRIDILVHSCNNKRFLLFCHIKFYCL